MGKCKFITLLSMKADGSRASSSPIFLITTQAKIESLASSPGRILLK